MRAALLIRSGTTQLTLSLDRVRTRFGSDPDVDVVLPDPDVPPEAGVISRSGSGFELDHDGARRTWLAGDILRVGPFELELRSEDERSGSPTLARPKEQGVGPELLLAGAGRSARLQPPGPFSIGTDEGNDWVLAGDGFASRLHCRFVIRDSRWHLEDLGSTNGTRVNGLRIGDVEVPPRATLTIGETDLRVFETQVEDRRSFRGMVGRSSAMRAVFDAIPRLARSMEPVLVHAESGCGKELVAQAIHAESERNGAFLALNCGALSAQLVESELFGHVKGAFTGALADKKGAFEAAAGGTLFLDEVGELPLELQPRLLRVLENRRVRPVGATQEVPVDCRIVAATHRNLESAVREGRFREDLFHRLFVLSLSIPPLRRRREDISVLATMLLEQSGAEAGLSPEAENKLLAHDWPGNVRELRNVLVRAVFARESGDLGPEHIRFSQDAFGMQAPSKEGERERFVRALAATGGNRSEAARMLGISKSTFFDRLRRHGIG
ncbi:MAG: sigma 54-interacting transcriptional regulator [Myxococcota bacterium]